MQTTTFVHDNIAGSVTRTLTDTFVSFGGAFFQIEAAKPELRATIEAAFAQARQAAEQRNRQAYTRGLSRNARRAQY